MTKQEMEQLGALKTEIRLLNEELHNLPLTTDSVTGSMPEHPYISHKIKIQGIDESKAAKLRRKLERKCEQLQDAISEMEDWLDGVDDSEMRTILRLRYRNGLSWQSVAREIGECDEQYPRRKCNKLFEKLKFDENDEL